jgi:protocatechuate 3,4-dioxygenase beta subunit
MARSFYHLTILFVLLHFSCSGQTVEGSCEGCEAIHEYGSKRLTSIDTLPGFSQSEHKLKVSGTVYHRDEKTPASGVILYIYHTDRTGVYARRGDEKGWARRHGYIRGWVKTDKQGRYTFFTFRPAAYPDGSEPEHIHLTVKEPDKNEYYLDDFLFEDDPGLRAQVRARLPNRGGSGISLPVYQDGILQVKRDIVLGLNIPNYE